MPVNDFLFRGDLADIDPDVADLINLEAERQQRCLIMIPSESTVPWAVRQALSSAYHNIYAEGYPPDETRYMTEAEILDADMRLAEFRRYSDPRYYKGTEFADLIESLARRRVAQLFATDRYNANQLYVNVQPLSGAPANSAVYTALISPGDTIMGMNLLHGGHLTHGSPAARSGKQYNAVWYGVHPQTDKIDYDDIRAIAVANKPKIMIAGYSSYPWSVDWARLKQIADEAGALLMADIAHVAGLVIGGVYPSPVGIADIVTFTTHKTLAGPRGAVILTHRADLGKKLERGVFPGEQGGPHVNSITALAIALKLAATPEFKALQAQMVQNAMRLSAELSTRGLKLAFGGTNTHLLNLDLKPLKGADGTSLSGDMAARILDLVGIVCNRNTIPGDDSAARPSGIRLGTPWITQRGLREPDMDRIADVIALVLKSAKPFSYDGKGGKADARAKLDYGTMVEARGIVNELADKAGIDYSLPTVGKRMPNRGRNHLMLRGHDNPDAQVVEIEGAEAGRFLYYALTSGVYSLAVGSAEATSLLNPDGSVLASGMLERNAPESFRLHLEGDSATVVKVAAWLQSLSDGFVVHDDQDLYGKIPGPVSVRVISGETVLLPRKSANATPVTASKDYFIGVRGAKYSGPALPAKPAFTWTEPENPPLKRTPLFDLHKELGAKIVPFAGYEMPVWYKGVSQEHAAVRTAAGLFDVSHMGVWEVSGPAGEHFLNVVTTNDVSVLKPGDAHYSYFLNVDGIPHDDLYIYRLEKDRFMLVVNASNNDKDWAWVSGLLAGKWLADPARPGATLLVDPAHVTLRDLRDPAYGAEQRVDIALQGPKSQEILLSLSGSEADKKKIKAMGWSMVTRATLDGFDLVISRTGYTGERVAYELFVHPDQAAKLFKRLTDAGAVPCGLASRDSTRIEAGLPLYGHELGGDHNFTPGDAGFASYVKLWKPFFVGKAAYLEREIKREAVITRFRMDSKGVRPPQPGTPILDRRGRMVGFVTSCSIDTEGFQTGQAYIREDSAADGTSVLIMSAAKGESKGAPKLGDKVPVPDQATVLTKFPVKKK